MNEIGGLFGLIIFVLNIYAIFQIVTSGSSILHKVLWVLLVFLLPLIGLVIWFFAGPRGSKRR
ncbi:MAG: PLDc N-terminal domain-containing protein [Alphaproteobacteria bacterium]